MLIKRTPGRQTRQIPQKKAAPLPSGEPGGNDSLSENKVAISLFQNISEH
ncbi:hypothetical protein [Chromobacterium sp. IIBBL 290-4]|nr:hypothetical protein [Chromobacterium sp. IIBBL 290-4]UTH72678.1 hypothetical protein NKT35_14140 [Chromobacterium sp. IIBBL 290-4]